MLQGRGGGEEKAGMEMETSQGVFLALLDSENSTKRECSHPRMPEGHHLENKEAKTFRREERESPEQDRI